MGREQEEEQRRQQYGAPGNPVDADGLARLAEAGDAQRRVHTRLLAQQIGITEPGAGR